MDELQRLRWLDELLDEVLASVAAAPTLADTLVFRGGRILRRHLGERGRLSTDLDATLRETIGVGETDRRFLGESIRGSLEHALGRQFAARRDGRFALDGIDLTFLPRKGHPFGWDMFVFRVRVNDARHRGVTGLPRLTLEVAAPEDLGEGSLERHVLSTGAILIYSLERIVAEKLRAFLQSTARHRSMIGSTPRAMRVRDLYDLGEVLRERPGTLKGFWDVVAREFRRACLSRSVSCEGWETFEKERETAASTWERDSTLSGLRDFGDVWSDVYLIVEMLERRGAAKIAMAMPVREGHEMP